MNYVINRISIVFNSQQSSSCHISLHHWSWKNLSSCYMSTLNTQENRKNPVASPMVMGGHGWPCSAQGLPSNSRVHGAGRSPRSNCASSANRKAKSSRKRLETEKTSKSCKTWPWWAIGGHGGAMVGHGVWVMAIKSFQANDECMIHRLKMTEENVVCTYMQNITKQ